MVKEIRFSMPDDYLDNPIKRIGVLPSGGDAPGMNAAVRAVTRTSIFYGREVVGIMHGYKGLIENTFKVLSSSDVSNIIQLGGTILKTARSMEFHTKEGRESAYQNLKNAGIDALVVMAHSLGPGFLPKSLGYLLLEFQEQSTTIFLVQTIQSDTIQP
jgi:hypothetical protein